MPPIREDLGDLVALETQTLILKSLGDNFGAKSHPGVPKMDPLRGPGHPQRVPRTTQGPFLEAKVDQETSPECQNAPPMVLWGRLWAPFGRAWGHIG